MPMTHPRAKRKHVTGSLKNTKEHAANVMMHSVETLYRVRERTGKHRYVGGRYQSIAGAHNAIMRKKNPNDFEIVIQLCTEVGVISDITHNDDDDDISL